MEPPYTTKQLALLLVKGLSQGSRGQGAGTGPCCSTGVQARPSFTNSSGDAFLGSQQLLPALLHKACVVLGCGCEHPMAERL